MVSQPTAAELVNEQQIRTSPEHHRQKDDEKDQRQPAQNFDEAHHGLVDAPARVARNRAVTDSNEHTDRGCGQPDDERDARAFECASVKITAEAIGAKPMRVRKRRLCRDRGPVERLTVVGIDERAAQHEQQQCG